MPREFGCPILRALAIGPPLSLLMGEEGDVIDSKFSDTVFAMRSPQNLKRRILKDALRENETRDAAFRRIIRSVPKGKVSTYGKVAAAAGYPLYHRAVARLLRKAPLHGLPWQRIVGAGGEIKLRGEAAAEQRLLLSIEGVKFRGKRVNMEIYEHTLRSWET